MRVFKRRACSAIVLILFCLGFAGCDEDSLSVIEVNPPDAATSVLPHTEIKISFDHVLNATSAKQGILLEKVNGEIVPTQFRFEVTSAVLVPVQKLASESTYIIRVSRNVQSDDGVLLGKDLIFSFSTQKATTFGEGVTVVGPTQFVQGHASVSLADVGFDERVMVIPVHATQAATVGQSTDGYDYIVSTLGLLPVAAPLKAATLHTDEQTRGKFLRHPKKFKRHWDAIKKVSIEERTKANVTRRTRAAGGSFGKCRAPYTVGKQCLFKVLNPHDEFVDVTATLRHVSGHGYFFVDNNDLSDFSTTELATLAQNFDLVAVPTNRRYFGELPDSDINGKSIIVLTRTLYDSFFRTGFLGYVAPWDFYPDGTYTDLPSNEGDIFYAVTPAPLQAVGYQRAAYFDSIMPSTMTHELKHLVSLGTRLLNNRSAEDLWLEEPSAVAAEELAGFGSMSGEVQSFAQYGLANPQDYRIEWGRRPNESDENYSMYGFNFLFLWRIAEQRGHDVFWKPWVAGPTDNIANLEAHTGATFESLMLEWALTLGFDHTGTLEGFDYESLNLRDGTWTDLGVQPLEATVAGSVRSAAYYRGSGLGTGVTIEIESGYHSPYFLVVRYPAP